ncbi:phosphotransferase [Quadrisphaera setariae]|uniref:phosphotransferase n=1 Tax=Quadrisphaera setariae TaxID=2593304 RepID=UPI00164F3C7B|nr:phosphotransferase [Quadrisphaera setariae]
MDLPATLVAVLERHLTSAPVTATAAAGTYASDAAAVVVLQDGEEVFVKASRDPERRADHLTEARIGAQLPGALPAPRLRGWTVDGEWVVLWFDALHAHLAAQPWTAPDVEAVVAAVERRGRLLTPSPVAPLRSVAEMVGSAFRVWNDLAAGRERALAVTDLDDWAREGLGELAALEAAWPAASAGETLCHFDPRTDNYLVDDATGEVWTIDWSRGCLGAPWVDLVTFLVTAQGDGHDAAALFAASPLSCGAEARAVDAHLAVLAGYWTEAAFRARPDSVPDLLAYQRRSLAGARTWLQERWADRR